MHKRIIACLVAAVMALSAVTVSAADTATETGTGQVSATVPVTGTIQPLTISVTHPISAAYAINPDANTFSAPALAITNNTAAPVNVTVQSLASSSGGSIQFTDKLPGDENWSSLSAADSKKYIALGITADNSSGWNSGASTTTDWAAGGTAAAIGSLNTGATGKLNLSADFGKAFDGSYTAAHNVVFSFSLA